MQQQVAQAEKSPPVGGNTVATAWSAAVPSAAASSVVVPSVVVPSAAASSAATPPPARQVARSALGGIAGGFGLLSVGFAALFFRLRRRAPMPSKLPVDGGAVPAIVRDGSGAESPVDTATHIDFDLEENAAPDISQDEELAMPPRVTQAAAAIARPQPESDIEDTRAQTIKLPIDAAQAEFIKIEATRLDYNLTDLDMTAQYVHLPSALNEHAVVKERRTNLADVLRLAIEREPDRDDLRMKLLELYYSAAATNKQAFLEVVQKFARDKDCLDADQWDKVAFMGRQIAPASTMFAEPAADDDLADCA